MPTNPPYFSGLTPLSEAEQDQLMPGAVPKVFRASSPSEAVVLCLHGFTGVPYEVAPLAEACRGAGVDAVTVLLPGHGYCHTPDQRSQFSRLTQDGLLTTAREVIAAARQQYRYVGMFGLSMGGALALAMAAENRLDACAVAAAALRLPFQAEVLIPLLSWASFYLEAKPASRDLVPGYYFYHSKALRALWQVSRQSRSQLHKIHCPTLAVHSHNDNTIPPVVMDWLQRDISPSLLTTSWYDESSHCMILDACGAAISQQVAQFMAKTLTP